MTDDKTDLVRQVFAQEVPEVAAGIIEIKSIARKPGSLTKVALVSHRPKIDCIFACVGNRGAIFKRIIDALGEPVDLVRWDNSPERLIANSLQPDAIKVVTLNHGGNRAIVVTSEKSRLSPERRAVSQELASKLCGWQIEIQTQ